MGLLLDTEGRVSPGLSDDLRTALITAGGAPTATVTPLMRHRGFHATVSSWQIGDGTSLMDVASDPVAVSTSAARLAQQPYDRVAVAAISAGAWTHRHHGVTIESTSDEASLIIVDPACPFDFRRSDRGSAVVIFVEANQLNLPPSSIRRAAMTLRPTHAHYRLYRSFLGELRTVALREPALLTELNATANQLTRALIIDAADTTAGNPTAAVPDSDPTALIPRVRRHIEVHLTDPELSAATIARAHNVSVRSLYKHWEATGIRLQDHIITLRLETAAQTLLTERHLSVAAVARRFCFADPTHFAHRFHDRFGVSPTAWRMTNP
ncbi:AraC family transcriptional regulator [Gordonia sp. PKS22-38]|uniref:AraC family transcriptional regulator n=1 Tax=Gordonia prachuapensis TaxID=3115651 RepID=A0ABU7MYK3_9ACTN|nr:AraC family transcriptional regulator [Gordonia sp. PKS22-38]